MIKLSKEQEPDIWSSLCFGAVLENVVYEPTSHVVDYDNTSLTENTRGSYILDTIPNAKLPAVGGHPKNVIFLTADAFGVLPPVSKLTPAQAMYHYISGYTAKVAGTEVGVKDPEPTFSPCFGGPFLVWHPTKYAEMLAEKLRKHGAQTWLVNTGWSGGAYGTGARIKLKYTRANHRRDPLGRARQRRHAGGPGVRPRRPDLVPRGAGRDACSRATRGPTRPPTTRRPARSPSCSRTTSRSTRRRRPPRSAAPGRRSSRARRERRAGEDGGRGRG